MELTLYLANTLCRYLNYVDSISAKILPYISNIYINFFDYLFLECPREIIRVYHRNPPRMFQRVGRRQLKQSLSLNDEETIILLTERSAAHRYYDSLARLVSMRQTTLDGVDERLNSVKSRHGKRERKRNRKVTALESYNHHTCVQ